MFVFKDTVLSERVYASEVLSVPTRTLSCQTKVRCHFMQLQGSERVQRNSQKEDTLSNLSSLYAFGANCNTINA